MFNKIYTILQKLYKYGKIITILRKILANKRIIRSKMKNIKYSIMVLVFASVVILAQAQQSEFQGTWIEEGTRGKSLQERLEISENRWTFFINNDVQAAGTAKFSAGRAELLLANGSAYFDLTLLAPGLIQQPPTWSAGLYRFRRITRDFIEIKVYLQSWR
ncbi:MAG: hypothetical protein LBV17_01510 [Treponema sp.]|jgi:hypothetical protein|nr:hypothetical protein [Treponema sp.]